MYSQEALWEGQYAEVKTPSHPRACVLRVFHVWNAFFALWGKHKTAEGPGSWTEVLRGNSWWSCLGFRADRRVLALVLAWRPRVRCFQSFGENSREKFLLHFPLSHLPPCCTFFCEDIKGCFFFPRYCLPFQTQKVYKP